MAEGSGEPEVGPEATWRWKAPVKWAKRIIVVVSLLVLFLVIVSVAAVIWVNHAGETERQRMLAELRERDLPTGLHTLRGKPEPLAAQLDSLTREKAEEIVREWTEEGHVPSEQEDAGGSRFFLAAFELARLPWEPYADIPYVGLGNEPEPGQPVPEDMQERLAAVVSENALFFDLVERARTHDHFHYDLTNGALHSRIMRVSGLARSCVRLLMVLSLRRQALGQGEEAADACSAMLDVCRSFDAEPIIWLSRASIDALAVGSLQETLSRTVSSPSVLETVRRQLLHEADALSPRRIARGNIAHAAEALVFYDRAVAAKRYMREQVLSHEQFAMRRVRDKVYPDEFTSAEAWRLQTRMADAWYAVCPGAYKIRAVREVREQVEWYQRATKSMPEYAAMIRRELREVESSSEEAAELRGRRYPVRHQALLRVATTALACEIHRLETGRWPGTLALLDARHSVDPFTGQALRFVETDAGRMVYSVGENGDDDGGAGRMEDADDISFRLFDVEKRNSEGPAGGGGPVPAAPQRPRERL